jgi:hypothetical protein
MTERFKRTWFQWLLSWFVKPVKPPAVETTFTAASSPERLTQINSPRVQAIQQQINAALEHYVGRTIVPEDEAGLQSLTQAITRDLQQISPDIVVNKVTVGRPDQLHVQFTLNLLPEELGL